jgi:hypothetical protein
MQGTHSTAQGHTGSGPVSGRGEHQWPDHCPDQSHYLEGSTGGGEAGANGRRKGIRATGDPAAVEGRGASKQRHSTIRAVCGGGGPGCTVRP